MDTKLKELIINEVTEEKLKELEDANAIPPNELFVTEDEDDALIIDEALDANSVNPIANKIVAQKFTEVDNKFTEITPSTTFAEAERQKSKNLSPSLIKGAYVFANGSYTDIEDFITTPIKIPVKPNTAYVASFNLDGFTINGSTGFIFYDINGRYIGYKANVLTWTTPSNCYYITFNIYKIGVVLSDVSDFMIEAGTVATGYQPYSGAITHNGDKLVVFAELERQKSLNLFNLTDTPTYSQRGVTYFVRNGKLNASGTTTADAYFSYHEIAPDLFETGKTYSALYTKAYDGTTFNLSFVLETNEGVKWITPAIPQTITNGLVITKCTLALYIPQGTTVSASDVGVMLYEGTGAHVWQPYNGPIMHKNDAPVVFAETERQKSKNLFNINANPEWLQGCTLSRTEDTLTFNTTSSNGKFGYKISGLTVGKQYTVSVQDISYANSLGLHIDYNNNSDTANFGRVTTENKSVTFTASADFVYIKGYASYDSGNTMVVTKLQLEEGSIATHYQPYTGAIVHENNTIFERAENKIRSFIENTDPEKYLSMQALTEFNRYGYRYNFTGETADELLNWIQNSAPQGFYTFYWSHGTVNGVEVMKASSQYAQVKVVYYFTPEYQVNRLEAGRWTGWKSIAGV